MAEIAPRPYEPDVAIAPGATIRDILEAKGMTQQRLAERMGRPANKINEILHGKRSITPETALGLERVLGWPAAFWMELEKGYQLTKARLEAEAAVKEPRQILSKYPISAMVKHGWIPKAPRPAAQVYELLKFFGLALPEQLECPSRFGPAFRKVRGEPCQFALAAWLRRGETEASELDTAPFSAARLQGALSEFRALTLAPPDNFAEKLVRMCADCGVATVFVPHLPRSYACGAAYWLGEKAVVQLSLRLNTNDQFWFSFFHEIGHILLHGKKEAFVDDFRPDEDEREVEANLFAADILISRTAYARLRAMPLTEASIRSFAQDIGVAPGIVLGRLQHDEVLPFSRLHHLKEKYALSKSEEVEE